MRIGAKGLILVALVSCRLVLGIVDDPLGVSSDAGDGPDSGIGEGGEAALTDVGSETGPSEGGGPCVPYTKGPTSVAIPTGVDGGYYCIDSTEVTQGQYQAFLDDLIANPSHRPNVPSECSGNDLAPGSVGACLSHGGKGFDPKKNSNYPAVCIDWCDAYTYCKWAGKRLCGDVDGGAVPPSDKSALVNTLTNQWHRACTGAGTRTYPYPGGYDPSACNGFDNEAGTQVPVASKASCQGGYSGLFDMSGNVDEWVDSCFPADPDASSPRRCHVRGGRWDSPDTNLRCDFDFGIPSTNQEDFVGFRCCAP